MRRVDSSSLKESVLASARWSVGGRVIQQMIAYGTMLVLARLLGPVEYGLVAMIAVVTGFATVLTEFGFGNALVQAPDLRAGDVAGAGLLAAAVGTATTLAFAFAAPLVASVFAEPRLTALTRLISVNFVLGGLAVVPRALLQRRLAFRTLSMIELAAILLSGATTIGLAVNGWGARALATGSVSLTLVSFLLILFVGLPDLRRFWARPTWPSGLVRYGMNITGFNAINYWARNVDNFLVGRWMGPAPLGIYGRAYNLMLFPFMQATGVLSGVMLSALAALQDDRKRARAYYCRSVALLAFATFPLSIGLSITAEPFTAVVLGSHWLAVAPVLRILALVGVFQVLCSPLGWIAQSHGRTEVLFWWGAGASFFIIGGLALGARSGSLQTLALLYLAVTVLLTYPALAIFGRIIDLSASDLLRPVLPALFCALAMGVGVGVMDRCVRFSSEWLRLVTDVGTGGLLYLALATGFRLRSLADLLEVLHLRNWAALLRSKRAKVPL